MAGYSDRFQAMLALTNPSHCFIGTDAIKAMMNSPKEHNNILSAVVRGGIHGKEEDIIPVPFRMAAIAPVNIPLVFGMLVTPAHKTAATLGLHFANQTYNSACNYFNRAGNSLTQEAILQSYGLACVSAMSMAYGLGKVMGKFAGPMLQRLPWFVPMCASCAAGSSNLVFMRMNELTEGTMVVDSDGTNMGYSKIAGADGVFKTALSRCCFVPSSVLLLPSLMMTVLKKVPFIANNPRVAIAAELSCVTISLAAALPATLAMFPSTTTFEVSKLEPEFHRLQDKDGKPIRELYASKGL